MLGSARTSAVVLSMSVVPLSSVLDELARACVQQTRGDVLDMARLLQRRPGRVRASESLRAALLDAPEGGNVGACRCRLRLLCGSRRHPVNVLEGPVPLLVLDTWYQPTRSVYMSALLPDPRIPRTQPIQVSRPPPHTACAQQLLQVVDAFGVPLPSYERAELLRFVEPRNWRKEPIGVLLATLLARLRVPLDLCNLVAQYGKQANRIVYVGCY